MADAPSEKSTPAEAERDPAKAPDAETARRLEAVAELQRRLRTGAPRRSRALAEFMERVRKA